MLAQGARIQVVSILIADLSWMFGHGDLRQPHGSGSRWSIDRAQNAPSSPINTCSEKVWQ